MLGKCLARRRADRIGTACLKATAHLQCQRGGDWAVQGLDHSLQPKPSFSIPRCLHNLVLSGTLLLPQVNSWSRNVLPCVQQPLDWLLRDAKHNLFLPDSSLFRRPPNLHTPVTTFTTTHTQKKRYIKTYISTSYPIPFHHALLRSAGHHLRRHRGHLVRWDKRLQTLRRTLRVRYKRPQYIRQ